MAVAFALMWLLDSLLASSLSEHWRRLVGAALGFGVLFGAGLPLFMVAKEHAEELRRQLTPHLPQPDRLLIIRSPADEASGFLAVFQFISQITVRSFLLAQSEYARFERLALRLASHKRKLLIVAPCAFLLSLVFLVGFAESTHGDAPNPMTKAAWLTGWAISLLVAALATYLVIPGIGAKGVGLPLRLLTSALLWPMMIALSILLVIPFGWQTAVANLFLDVTVDATPVGSWEVHLVRPPTSEELGRPVPPLLHVVYENPRALEKLSEWMAARLESKGKVEPGRS